MKTNKKTMLAALTVLSICAILSGFAVSELSDSSDAVGVTNHEENWTAGTYVDFSFSINPSTSYSWKVLNGSMPPGISIVKIDSRNIALRGTPNNPGIYEFTLECSHPTYVGDYHHFKVYINNPAAVKHVVTYNAGIGLINGQSSWSEEIIDGGHPSLPSASYSTGAYSFRGWATTSTASTPNVTSSATITGPTTYYAVFQQNVAYITTLPGTSTISHGQSWAFGLNTNPANASISISNSPSGWGIGLSGKTISGTVPDGVTPGSYYIVLRTSASGYGTSTQQININVPVYIVPSIEKQQTVGTTFNWEPVTNPTNATITIASVKLDGTTLANSGFSMSGRTINGPLNTEGVYAIEYRASASGYVSSSAVIRVAATPIPDVQDPATISSITTSQRPDEPRTWDFVAVNASNYSSISWSTQGTTFQTASTTAVYEFQTSGVYDVTCSLVGFDSQTVTKTVTVAVLDTYYPELAWVGVAYSIVLTDSPTVNVGTATWLNVTTSNVGGTTYTVISGTPPAAAAGLTYDYTIGTEARTITVYAPESVVPTASFDIEIGDDGFTANITWTGSNASVVYYDYGDGSDPTTSTTHTYTAENAYVVKATAVNNLGERIATSIFYVDGYDDPTKSTRPLELTDIELKKGEKVWIPLTILEGETVSLLGTATLFCTLVENVITGDTGDVDIGDYSLVVTLTDADGEAVQKTITITIVASEDDEEDDDDSQWIYYVLVAFAILVILYIVWKAFSGKGKNGTKNGGRR